LEYPVHPRPSASLSERRFSIWSHRLLFEREFEMGMGKCRLVRYTSVRSMNRGRKPKQRGREVWRVGKRMWERDGWMDGLVD